MRGRQTAAMLDIAGLAEFATETDDDYVGQAIGLASSKTGRTRLRERMSAGSAALFDDAGSVRALERVLLGLVT